MCVVAPQGEGPRYGDFKCNHDSTHRVCATLKDTAGNKISWGTGDFWQVRMSRPLFSFSWFDKFDPLSPFSCHLT